jgi:hypothetical protein
MAALLRAPTPGPRIRAGARKPVRHAEAAPPPEEEELLDDAAAAPPVDPDSYAGRLLAARGRARARLDTEEEE